VAWREGFSSPSRLTLRKSLSPFEHCSVCRIEERSLEDEGGVGFFTGGGEGGSQWVHSRAARSQWAWEEEEVHVSPMCLHTAFESC